MNGYQLYQHYTQAGQLAYRDSDAWCYGQLLQRAFYVAGITRLFDLLEQAEGTNKRLGLVYTSEVNGGAPIANDIELIDQAPPTVPANHALSSQPVLAARTYLWFFS